MGFFQDLNMEKKIELGFLEENPPNSDYYKNVWYAGLITAVHTCFVPNREIIHVAKRKGAVIF